jgi:hypothetical protein
VAKEGLGPKQKGATLARRRESLAWTTCAPRYVAAAGANRPWCLSAAQLTGSQRLLRLRRSGKTSAAAAKGRAGPRWARRQVRTLELQTAKQEQNSDGA